MARGIRTRILVKTPLGIRKIANICFSKDEPSFYINFPYLNLQSAEKFLVWKSEVLPEKDLVKFEKESCFFFQYSPKFSYHLSGQTHIKDSKGKQIFMTQTEKLDSEEPRKLFNLIIKNPLAFDEFRAEKDIGTTEDKNLFLNCEESPDCIELTGYRIVLAATQPWFDESSQNHPILGERLNPITGDKTPSICFNFSPNQQQKRILFAIDLNLNKKFTCDEDRFIYFQSGFSETYSKGLPYTQLVIMAPREPDKMIYN